MNRIISRSICPRIWSLIGIFELLRRQREPGDSSAAAIAACGMLEMSKYPPEEKAAYYTEWPDGLLRAGNGMCVYRSCTVQRTATVSWNLCKKLSLQHLPNNGVDECDDLGRLFYMGSCYQAFPRLGTLLVLIAYCGDRKDNGLKAARFRPPDRTAAISCLAAQAGG